jgi:hypothetical protein
LAGPLYWSCRNQPDPRVFWELLFSQTIVIYFLTIFVSILGTLPRRRRYLAGILEQDFNGQFPESAYEYRSRLSLLGLPLIHVRIGDRFDVLRGPVKAWIAIGSSHAVGMIFAMGGIAVAPIAFGGVAIGVFSLGAIALGIFPMGAISLGFCAYGGLAVGWQVFCGCGAAWNAAMGGIVVAHNYAVGGIARALHTNSSLVKEYYDQNMFFQVAQVIARHGFLTMMLWVVPVAWQARMVARARRRREMANS